MSSERRHKPIEELFGLPDAPKVGRDRLIHVAIGLFYSYGFQAVGIDHILTEAGVTKTTFYKHFKSRTELLIAAIKRRDEWETRAWRRAVQRLAGDDPRAQLLAYFDVLDIWFSSPEFRGCQFINAAAEFPNPSDPVHAVAAEYKRKSRAWFRDLAASAGARDPDAFADQYTALVEGTLILRQVHGRDDAARVMKPTVSALLVTALASSADEPAVAPQSLPSGRG